MKVLAFPFHDWRKGEVEGIRWRDGHILETLAERADCELLLIVDRPVSLAERIATRRPTFVRGQALDELRSGRRMARLTQVRQRIVVLDTAVPDALTPAVRRRGWWFTAFTDPWTLDAIAWAVERTTGPHPAVIAWTPTVAPAIERVEPSRLVYDSLDNWLIHPLLRRHAAAAADGYQRILPRADAVIASAPASRRVLERWVPRVETIANGVDPAQFAEPRPRPEDLPAGPIVGYAGSLASRIDAELVAGTARALPEATFVFIGRIMESAAIRQMRGLPNVRIMGNRPYSRLPDYLQHFDVAWIPHAVGPGETGGDPIKLYEYWAAGRQVVTTAIDGMGRWADRVHLVQGVGDAVATVGGLLAGTTRPKPVAVPQERTWQQITDRIAALLEGGGSGGGHHLQDRRQDREPETD
jgi:glycosyltransferase involved in cell wall biosynthesis